MRPRALICLILLLAVPALLGLSGCQKRAVGPPGTQAQARPKGPLFVLHRWKGDDSLSFLALYYAGREEAAREIQAANPGLTFSGRLPVGRAVWIPEEILLPKLRQQLPLVERQAEEGLPPAKERGVLHRIAQGERLEIIALFYTGRRESLPEILAANPDLDPHRPLRVGQEIFVPESLILPSLKPRLTLIERPAVERRETEPAPPPPPKLKEENLGVQAAPPEQSAGVSYTSPLTRPTPSNKDSAKQRPR